MKMFKNLRCYLLTMRIFIEKKSSIPGLSKNELSQTLIVIMEKREEDTKMNQDHKQVPCSKKKGGFITLPFIIANESFEKVASYGLLPNMIIYLMKDYKMSVTAAQNLLYFWTAALNFLPIVGAFVADSFAGRFLTIGIGSIISLLGMITLWMTTLFPQAKPPPCDPLINKCQSPTTGQYSLLIVAFTLMSFGAGGVRPCSQAFGADQVDQRDSPKNQRVLETFFNFYYACGCFSVVIAMTVIVYIQDHYGWKIGFGIPVFLMFLSAVSFFLVSPYYLTIKVKKSLFSSVAQVIVAAFKNRRMSYLAQGTNMLYYQSKECEASLPSRTLRFLNKACIIKDPDQDIGPDGLAVNPWRLTTVEEVEGLKSLLRIIPIWSTSIMMSVTVNVGSFPVLLAQTMDRHLGPKFEIPAASFSTFLVIVIVIWIPIYDRLLLPLASKVYGKPVRLSVKLRMGIGLFCSTMSMVSAATVESIRRQKVITEGLENNPQAVLQMSALMTIPQYVFAGLAEAFNGIGQTEFYYSELPKNMSSIATCLSGVGLAFGSLLAGLIMNVVDGVTRKGGKEGWITSNVNKGHYDYYYWLLAMLSFMNIIYYLYCSWMYGPLVEQRRKVAQKEINLGVDYA
ncbi:protein NRT1/ PTR FAMILY 1.2-like isoform X2 [Silene latifolia]|uniref:protein NRT1/ PTR FAMILY 1.2-like isoform X2 n=1 Tax=Silene latifolia TaxID=37657 RepID=UPI003D7814EE